MARENRSGWREAVADLTGLWHDVQSRLLLGFGVVVVLLAFVAVTGYVGLVRFLDAQDAIVNHHFANVSDLLRFRVNENAERLDVSVMLDTPGKDWGPWRQELDERSRQNDEVLRKLLTRFRDNATALTRLKELMAARSEFAEAQRTQVLTLLDSGRIPEARALFLGPQLVLHNRMRELARDLEAAESAQAREIVAKTRARWRAYTAIFAVLGSGAVLGAAALAVFMRRVIAGYITERQQAEASLRRAGAYNRSLIEASLDPLVTISAEGKITDVNEASVQATGLSRERLIGRDFSEYFTEPDKARAGYQRAFAEGFVRDYPLALRHASGRVTEVLYNARVYRDDQGQVRGVFAAARDVTELKQAEAAVRLVSAYNRSLIEASLDPLVTISAEGKITDVNEALVQATGLSRERLIGTDFCEFFTEPDKARAGYQQVFAEGYVRDYPLAIRHVSGPVTDVLYNARIYRDDQGQVRGVFAAARDITKRRRAEEALKAERQRFEEVLNRLPAYVVLLAPDYHVPFANRFFEQRFGQARGRRCHEYLFNRPGPCENCETFKVLKTQAPLQWEWTGPDGRQYEIHDFPFTDVDGSPLILEMGLDITERKRAEAELRHSESVQRQLAVRLNEAQALARVGSWELDLRANVLTWSDETYRIFGVDAAKFGASYQAFLERVHPDDRVLVHEAYTQSVANRIPYAIDHRLRMPEGSLKFVHEQCRTYYDTAGKPVRSIGTVQDITERKQAEEQIRQLNAELEQRVAQRTAELAASNRELEAFSYSVSHDLRAPLRSIDGFSQVLLEDYSGKLDEEGRDSLARVRAATQRMAQLIDDLLKLSRVTRSGMHRVPADLSVLARWVAAELRRMEPQRQAEFVIAPELPVVGDHNLLLIVLENLLGNAWKFTRKQPAACIEVGVQARGVERVFFVRDNGAGFDMKYADKLFGAFQRLHAAKDYEGTGIGLATVQRVIRRHGGQVWAESEVGKGATFFFTLPDQPAEGGVA